VSQGTWVVMGSSTASGAGATTLDWAFAVRTAYRTTHGVTTVNIARGGQTTYSALPTGTPAVANRPAPNIETNTNAALTRTPAPKLVFVSYPTNDTEFGYTVEETVRNTLAVRAALIAGGAAVIVVSTQPRDMTPAKIAMLPQIDAQLKAAIGACFAETREALDGPDGKLDPAYNSGDGIHPNDAGHAVIASIVRDLIDSGNCVRVVPGA
jgi:lysophospholipase L1-like esterase